MCLHCNIQLATFNLQHSFSFLVFSWSSTLYFLPSCFHHIKDFLSSFPLLLLLLLFSYLLPLVPPVSSPSLTTLSSSLSLLLFDSHLGPSVLLSLSPLCPSFSLSSFSLSLSCCSVLSLPSFPPSHSPPGQSKHAETVLTGAAGQGVHTRWS